MINVNCLNNIAACGLKLFSDEYNTESSFEDAQAVLVRSAKMHDMELSDNLLAIARAGAGVNNIPLDKCAEEGIVVFNTPGANANAVKEQVIAAMLLASRDIVGGIEWAATVTGDDAAKQIEKGKSNFAGSEIKGKTLGVIGLGAIGILVANAAVSLGMSVVGYDPYLSVNNALKLSRKVTIVNDQKAVFEAADMITVHVPLMDSTKNTINAETIAMMKDGVIILNFARGGLVNTTDIKAAIESGKVAKYVVDFPDASVLGVKNVIAIPHLGASTEESENNCAVMAADEIKEFLETGNVTNSVNFPNCSLPMGSKGRIAMLHKNVPNVIAGYTNALAKVNISDMVNKSRGDIAYTIINTDHEIPESAVKEIEAMDTIIAVRVIK